MFSTTLAAAAVGGLLVSGSIAIPPAWQTDYRTAIVQSAEQRKPVAVFIAPGGHDKLVTDGKIGQEAVRMLRQSYICLDVDTTKDSGKVIAQSFGISEGLVISDKTGSKQALRHGGAITSVELEGYLNNYSSGDTPVTTNVVNNAVVPSTGLQTYTQPYRVCGPNGCSTVSPASYSAPAGQVIGNTVGGFQPQIFGGYRSSCASGNCYR
jgi:hypothetical protein